MNKKRACSLCWLKDKASSLRMLGALLEELLERLLEALLRMLNGTLLSLCMLRLLLRALQ